MNEQRPPVLPAAPPAPATLTRLVVLPAEAGPRLDQFLATASGLSRRRARSLIADGQVIRNQQTQRVASRGVEVGDVVEVLLPPAEVAPRPWPVLPEISVLYEDRWLVVGDKPAGVLSQPAEGRAELAFDQMMTLHLASLGGRRPFLRLVHRIDRQTSGAVLFARNPQALPPLAELWASGRVERSYLAIVDGSPPDKLQIDAAIARDRSHRWRFQVDAGGRPALTELRTLARRADGSSVVLCRLHTGRTHQVRVHLAHAGHVVLGDRLYGAPHSGGAERPLLHALSLRLPHPASGDAVLVTAPIPADMLPMDIPRDMLQWDDAP